jgi:5-methylcytosine-specific restriction endonuclease McrA
MISKEKAKKMAQSRDCSCIKGKDRDNNYNECIDKIYKSFKEDIKIFQEIHRELMNEKQAEINFLKRKLIENLC